MVIWISHLFLRGGNLFSDSVGDHSPVPQEIDALRKGNVALSWRPLFRAGMCVAVVSGSQKTKQHMSVIQHMYLNYGNMGWGQLTEQL